MLLSKKIEQITPSGTVMLAQKARELKALGRDIIELGEGEPDFQTPEFIIEEAFQAARNGATKYTSVAGTEELRIQIKKKFHKENNLNYGLDQIIVGTGAKQLIFNALLASLNPGDEVIIPSPYWVSYPEMVKISEGKPIIVNCPENEKFILSPESLENAISPNTKWVLMNSPNNPTGAVYNWEELSKLADVIRRYEKINVMCDDIYEKLVYDDSKFCTMAEVSPDLADRILTVNGVSKAYAMTGWRIGYAAGPKCLINAMGKLQGQSTTNASSLGQAAALAALQGNQDYLLDWISIYQNRRNLVSESLGDIFGYSIRNPQGAFYHFIPCMKLFGKKTPSGKMIGKDAEFCEYLLQDFGVAVVPGSEFGCNGYFRLCFAKSEIDLKEACKRIIEAVDRLT